MRDAAEVLFERFAVDGEFAVARRDPHARDGVFALAGAVRLVSAMVSPESAVASKRAANASI